MSVSNMFQQGGELFKLLIEYSKLLPLEKEVMAMYYRLVAVIMLECGKNKFNDCLQLIVKLQVSMCIVLSYYSIVILLVSANIM